MKKDSNHMGLSIAVRLITSGLFTSNYKFGYFYALAPENGCSAPVGFINNFDKVWQYGTAEPGQQDPHKPSENDGVAPQCGIPGLDWNSPLYGRVRFQGMKKHLNFVEAHLGQNYDWVTKLVGRGIVNIRN